MICLNVPVIRSKILRVTFIDVTCILVKPSLSLDLLLFWKFQFPRSKNIKVSIVILILIKFQTSISWHVADSSEWLSIYYEKKITLKTTKYLRIVFKRFKNNISESHYVKGIEFMYCYPFGLKSQLLARSKIQKKLWKLFKRSRIKPIWSKKHVIIFFFLIFMTHPSLSSIIKQKHF